MKKLFNPGIHQENINYALLFLRIAIGVMMLTHGWGKLVTLFGNDPIQFADPFGMGPAASLGLSVFAEVFCSILLIFGFLTRFAAITLIINMSTAVIFAHAADPFSGKEMALLYLTVSVTILSAGAGKFSLDNLLYNKIRDEEPEGEPALERR